LGAPEKISFRGPVGLNQHAYLKAGASIAPGLDKLLQLFLGHRLGPSRI
jgi:hypothetical protein